MGYADCVRELTMTHPGTPLWPDPGDLDDHWRWRPEWAVDRPCWYWYLTFDAPAIARAVGAPLLSAVEAVPWLDPVPPAWMHLTLCDVGFADELDPQVVHDVVAAVEPQVAERLPMELSLRRVAAMHGAVVLPAGPLEALRRLWDAVASATQRVLGPTRPLFHRHELWPHVSLGYVNRAVGREDVASALGRWPLAAAARVAVDGLTLASVTRRDRHYQWQVTARVDRWCSSHRLATPARHGSR